MSSYITYILEQLGEKKDIRARAMFGGYGLYQDGIFFGLVANDILYFKVNDTTREKYIKYTMKPFSPYGQAVMQSYYEVPVSIIENADELNDWATEAYEIARASKKTKHKKK